mgnify:CR=1 FL=1
MAEAVYGDGTSAGGKAIGGLKLLIADAPETGVVGEATWDEIYDQFSGIENTSLRSGENFPRTPERR